jgi:hypothetical protein
VSPFDGVGDLYRLERMPLSDSIGLPRTGVVYEVDRRLPGSLVAAPDKRLA